MKLSDYHDAHGLDGTIRLTQTGEVFHFDLVKGQNALHVTVNTAGHVKEGVIRFEKIPGLRPDEPFDMKITLEVPAGAASVPLAALATPTLVEVPAAAVELDIDGAPKTGDRERVVELVATTPLPPVETLRLAPEETFSPILDAPPVEPEYRISVAEPAPEMDAAEPAEAQDYQVSVAEPEQAPADAAPAPSEPSRGGRRGGRGRR